MNRTVNNVKSRNHLYTVTFDNVNGFDIKQIERDFNAVGRVKGINKLHRRYFIRYEFEEEAERAIDELGEYNVSFSENSLNLKNQNDNSTERRANCNSSHEMDSPNGDSKAFHLILGNLPKSYTIEDVQGLVEEVKPLYVSQLDETKVLGLKFCHIAVNSAKSLSYLINKLDGFMIRKESLIAVEADKLMRRG